jgi:hypothetical protein
MTEPLTVVEEYLVELRGALRVSARRRERILAEARRICERSLSA